MSTIERNIRSEALVILDMVWSTRSMTLSGWHTVGRPRIDALRCCIERVGPSHQTNCTKFTGDGFLLAFHDPQNFEHATVDAFRATLAIAREINVYNAAATPELRTNLRFALHYGAVDAVAGDREGFAVTYTFRMEGIKSREFRKASQEHPARMFCTLPTLSEAVPTHLRSYGSCQP